jgi:hypothetical protein
MSMRLRDRCRPTLACLPRPLSAPERRLSRCALRLWQASRPGRGLSGPRARAGAAPGGRRRVEGRPTLIRPPSRPDLASSKLDRGRWLPMLRAGRSCLRSLLAILSSHGRPARPHRTTTTADQPPPSLARLLRRSARPAVSTRRAAAAAFGPARSARDLGAAPARRPRATGYVA